MSEQQPGGPHLVLRFREHNARGRQEIRALAFALDSSTLQVADPLGDWRPLLRFDYNNRRWQRVGGGAPVSELKLDHSEDEKLTLAFYDGLDAVATEQSIGERDAAGTVLFERPPSARSVLAVKFLERYAYDGAGRRRKTKLAYQDVGFRWRALGNATLGVVGTLAIRTPGRSVFPEPVKIQPGHARRPSGLALGLDRAA